MSNENNTGLPQNENWLDDILGTETPKAELSSQELAQQVEEPLDLDKLMEESWDTDLQTLEHIQDSVAQELPTIPMEEQFTTRIPFADPDVSVEFPQEQPTMAIPVLEQTALFTPAQEQQLLAATEGTQRFDVPPAAPEQPQVKPEQPQVKPEQPQAKQEQPAKTQEQPKKPQEQPAKTQEQPKKAEKQSKKAEKQPKKAEKQPAAPDKSEKGRPAHKKGYGLFGIPHIVSTFIWLAIIVVAGVSLGRMMWVCCADVMAFGKPNHEITIEITTQDVQVFDDGSTKVVDIDAISQKLGDAGLIEYPQLFKLFATLTGKDQNLSSGTYTLNSYYDYNAMINGMSSYQKPRQIVTVVIPEGYNCAQLFALLEAYEVCTIEELEQSAADGKEAFKDYWFLGDDIPWGEKYCLEGYLFPDTYEFYTNDDPTHVLDKMLTNFDARFTDKMKENLTIVQQRYGLSLHEILTIASMVEEEAVGATKTSTEYEGYNLASVYYNRLVNKNGEFPTHIMGCDATVYYAMGDYFGASGELTAAHLETDSPYNTRKYGGLPPGPITNPGSYSIYAALDPNDTDYHYYVYDPDQRCHVLAKSESEFNKLLDKLGY